MTDEHDHNALSSRDGQYYKRLKRQADVQDDLGHRLDATEMRQEARIQESEALLKSIRQPIPQVQATGNTGDPIRDALPTRPWCELVREAELAYPSDVGISDLLTPDEIQRVLVRIEVLRGDFDQQHRLDGLDWCIAGVAGSLGALVDTFLLIAPRAPGLLGGAPVEGGPMSNFMRDRLRSAYSSEEISNLERRFRVPYDAAHSGNLRIPVAGLGPRTHRFQSLGHDPLLGFIFGVADILQGRITTIDSQGYLIRQPNGPLPTGMGVFEAIATQMGHLRSDVATPAGLPAPLAPLLSTLQIGSLGDGHHTIGEMARLMYARGYDFGHFLAMSVPTLLIEVIVRVAYFVKRLSEGHSLERSLPFSLPGRPPQPKLNTMLFTAHIIAAATNGGRAALLQNPLALNYPEWIVFAKTGIQQLRWVLYQKEQARFNFVQSHIDADWDSLRGALASVER